MPSTDTASVCRIRLFSSMTACASSRLSPLLRQEQRRPLRLAPPHYPPTSSFSSSSSPSSYIDRAMRSDGCVSDGAFARPPAELPVHPRRRRFRRAPNPAPKLPSSWVSRFRSEQHIRSEQRIGSVDTEFIHGAGEGNSYTPEFGRNHPRADHPEDAWLGSGDRRRRRARLSGGPLIRTAEGVVPRRGAGPIFSGRRGRCWSWGWVKATSPRATCLHTYVEIAPDQPWRCWHTFRSTRAGRGLTLPMTRTTMTTIPVMWRVDIRLAKRIGDRLSYVHVFYVLAADRVTAKALCDGRVGRGASCRPGAGCAG